MDQSFSLRLLPDRPSTQSPPSYNQLSMNAFHHKKSPSQTTLPYECIDNSNNNSHLIMSNNNNNDTMSSVPMSSIKMERDDCFDSSSPDLMRCKRSKFSPSSFSLNGSNPPVAARRNERERNRVKQVNMGFSTLRQRVPDGVKNKKMSKVETLRSAVDYIKKLQKMLNESSNGAEGMMTTMCGSRENTETSSCTPDSGVSYHHAASSGHDVDSSPISSTSPSSVMEASDISYNDNNNDREQRCFPGSDDDIISFAKWFS